MTCQTETAAVIPCLNEAATLQWLVPAVQEHVAQVCVVDDGSSDGTAAAAEQGGAHVIRHPSPRGKGTALRAGWQWARAQGLTWVLTMDGDGQHLPSDIPNFFRSADRSGVALVVGNRMQAPAPMPLVRRVVNRWMSRRLSRLVQHELPDSQCGFRLVNLAALSELAIDTHHFEIESEVLVAFVRAGHAVEFVPVSVIYHHEQSKIRPLRDSWRWLRWWRGARKFDARRKPGVELGGRPSLADA